MYMIETHSLRNASTVIVLEKHDTALPYEQFAQYKVITNHLGDVDARSCRWCVIQRRAALMKERKANTI